MPTISTVAHAIQYSGPIDEIAAALAFHDGDARAAIGTLLADIRFLKQQLAITKTGMSIGFTRGWEPSYERDIVEENADAGQS